MRVSPTSINRVRTAASATAKAPSKEPGAAETSPLENQDWFDAGSLMQEKGLELEGRTLMRENLATYLAHRPKGKALPSGRWETKLERELAQPYTDEQVLEHLSELQDSLKENLATLPSYPKAIFLTGSFSKGRLGANSDLNGYAPLPSEQFDQAFQGFQTRYQGEESANLFPMSESSPGFNKAMMMVEGTSVKISTERLSEDGYLQKVYRDILAENKTTRRETSPKLDGLTGKMWRSKFERETFHFKAMRWALHLGGTLARIPLLGSLVEAAGSKVVAQNHRDFSENFEKRSKRA